MLGTGGIIAIHYKCVVANLLRVRFHTVRPKTKSCGELGSDLVSPKLRLFLAACMDSAVETVIG